jgi:hypothetical protein
MAWLIDFAFGVVRFVRSLFAAIDRAKRSEPAP